MKCSFISVVSFGQVISTMALFLLFEVGARGQATCVELTCPTNITETMPCGDDCLTISTYPPVLATNTCNPTDLVVSYYPPPGSCFPLGTTPVTVTAVGSGVTNTCGFTVTVLPNDNCAGSLPVYTVVQSGAFPPQAAALASSLGIPAGGYVLTNGQMDFIDPANFIAAPVQPVTDPAVRSNLMADTVNKVPGIPINFEQLNFAALNTMTVPGSNTAVLEFATGLTNAGLVPQSATPIVTHTVLSAIYTNGGTVMTASNSLDTEVNYQLTLAGFPVVGPGAQVQAAFGPSGAVTRLHYAARRLAAGPMVTLISPSVASNTAVALYGGIINAQVSVQLVYYAPPLSLTTVSTLIPWYLCGGTTMATNPTTSQISPIHLMRVLIPATADPNYVPAVQETAIVNGGGTQVVASASVSGGTPPYTYLWSGSPPDLFTNPGPRIQYTPVIQATPTDVSISPAAPGSAMLSWPDPLGLYQMQSTPSLALPAWTIFTNDVNICNEVNMVTINTASKSQFYRLALTNQPAPFIETVGLKIVDNNGIYVGTRQNVGVNVVPVLNILGLGSAPVINWGTDTPYDEDFCSWDDSSWRSSMENYPSIFGPEQFDRGEYIALPEDFIAPPHGWQENVIDTAALVFYNGHGNPNAITFTSAYEGSGTPFYVLWNNALDIGDWGSHQEDWMALLSCEVLAQVDDPNPDYLAFERWGPAFNGLHSMLGFETEAWSDSITGIGGDSFETVFVKGMAGKSGWTLKMQQAWFHAALTTGPIGMSGGIGEPAYLGPIGPGGVWDFDDFFWGMGPVGPTIRAQNTHGQQNILGWFYMYQTQ
ncbi:MAG TPA: DUF6345 domain-containing protein [Candidatus Acidoferrum sp.]|nr:DUF6345 domain-containing protein [Candidatus Acidoferrum sp.]